MPTKKQTYSDKLKHPQWQKKRLEILKRDKFTCKLCKDHETTLHVHHNTYEPNTEPWDYPSVNFTTLCEHCHCEIESLKGDGLHISEIKIYKSNNWKNKSRIMFIAKPEECTMRIYNESSEYVVGYNLPTDTMTAIIKTFKYSINTLSDPF